MSGGAAGLLHALQLDGAGRATRIQARELDSRAPRDGLCWVHLDYTDPEAARWLESCSGLDPVVTGALLTAETRPRVTEVNGGLLIALRGVNLNPGADPEDMVAVRIWLNERQVITSLRRRMLPLDDIVAALERGQGPGNAAEFIIALCQGIAEYVEPVVEAGEDGIAELEQRLADLEDRVASRGTESLRKDLAETRREVIALRRYLAPQREAINRLAGERVVWLDDGHRLALREIGDHLVRQIEDLDVVRERAALTIEELYSHLSEQLNRRLYILSVAAAIFLPLTFLTGLLGINVGGIPGSTYRWAFYVVIGVVLVVLAGQVWLLRRLRWL